MSTTKILHTFHVELDNGKVAITSVVATSYGRNASTIVDMHVKVTGHAEMVENIGSIEHLVVEPDCTHAFYPTGLTRRAGIRAYHGDLNTVRTHAVTAAAVRIGAIAAQIAANVEKK